MLFEEAVEEFRNFLRMQGHSGPLQWIAPSDVAFWCGELLIRPRSGAEAHANHVFGRAQERGFGVSIEAIAMLDHSICCFLFAPDDAEDSVRNFVAPPLTMKVRQDLRPAQGPGGESPVVVGCNDATLCSRTVSGPLVFRTRFGPTK